MADPTYETALGSSTKDTVTLLGQDLAGDVMGTVGFGELAFWLATQRRPGKGETRVFEAVLAALADLGLPLELLRGFALLARTAGLIGQLAEELRHPVANDIFLSVDLNNRSVAPDPHP
jgi:citrate synthase